MNSSSTFTIRPIEPDDSPALLSMMRELARFEEQEHLIGATEESIRRDGFGAAAQFGGFIALDGGEPAGFVTYGNAYTTWGRGSSSWWTIYSCARPIAGGAWRGG